MNLINEIIAQQLEVQMFSIIKTAIEDALTGSLKREQLANAKEQLAELQQKYESLIKDNEQLTKELKETQIKLILLQKEPEFVDAGICLIKKMNDGSYCESPFCVSCKGPLVSLNNMLYICPKCKSQFNGADIKKAFTKCTAS